jgi:soluble lytic murein transglycosylase-like protein
MRIIFRAATVAICTAVWAVSAGAEITTPTVNYFKPKRVVPPAPGTKRFITIQIDPEEQRQALAATAARPFMPVTKLPADPANPAGTAKAPAEAAAYAWYWDAVSPALGARDGRFDKAVSALGQGPGGKAVTTPRLAHLQDIAQRYGAEILSATIGTEVSPALALAVISTESGGRHDAVSKSGAVGLMQLIPATADRFKVGDSTDPVQNIKGGVAYLDWLMKEFDRDPLMVIAAYNAGENAVKNNGGVPPYAETRDYVPKVLAAWSVARGLCRTPPELVTDGCVFVVKG